jgi:hypothetical protein
MLDLSQLFTNRNRETAANWESFAGHREHLRRLIDDSVPAVGGRGIVLGAGNCNDLDLPWLQQRFAQTVLLDLDLQAMQAGIARQLGTTPTAGIEPGLWDVTGAFDLLNALGGSGTPSSAELAALERRLESTPPIPPESPAAGQQFDCVVSACLVSQLIDAIKRAVGESHPRFLPLVLAVRRQHVATLLSLATPGGSVLLVFDFVSSLTAPELASVPTTALGEYAAAQVGQHNFFTGLNPAMVLQAVRKAEPACGYARPPALTPPWRWDLGPRTYLVAAVTVALAKSDPVPRPANDLN